MIWSTRHREFDLTQRGAIMGILNVTPDSFSDGGRWVDLDAAVGHARQMIEQGAEIVDVGGESTRPGAKPVAAEEELRRVAPVIGRLCSLPGHGKSFVVSVDTMKPAVARLAVEAGAAIVNDVGGLRDPEMIAAIKETGASVVIMHMQGEPRTMQSAPRYGDVTREVREFFCQRMDLCLRCGVPAQRIAFDPGFGFGKTVEHNLTLLRRLPELVDAGRPLLVGVSRKTFIGKATGTDAIENRAWPTVAMTSLCRERGARILRVHEVKPNAEALRMTEAILGT
ncbi:MAG: dihydropteroate synthase [Chthoniobacteraceae bacterium]